MVFNTGQKCLEGRSGILNEELHRWAAHMEQKLTKGQKVRVPPVPTTRAVRSRAL